MLSIITPNLNNGQYLEGNIRSIQKLPIPFEHIIVDGGSTDNSLEIIAQYPHVKVLHQTERTGMYGAIHQGIQESGGEYVGYVNADDRIVVEGFEALYHKITKGDADVVYADGYYEYIHEQKKEFAKGRRLGKFFVRHGCMPAVQPSIIFTRRIYDQVGGLRYQKFKICGDLDLFVRIAQYPGSTFSYVPKVATVFMKRGDSLGDRNTERYQKELKDNGLPVPTIPVRILYRIGKYL